MNNLENTIPLTTVKDLREALTKLDHLPDNTLVSSQVVFKSGQSWNVGIDLSFSDEGVHLAANHPMLGSSEEVEGGLFIELL